MPTASGVATRLRTAKQVFICHSAGRAMATSAALAHLHALHRTVRPLADMNRVHHAVRASSAALLPPMPSASAEHGRATRSTTCVKTTGRYTPSLNGKPEQGQNPCQRGACTERPRCPHHERVQELVGARCGHQLRKVHRRRRRYTRLDSALLAAATSRRSSGGTLRLRQA